MIKEKIVKAALRRFERETSSYRPYSPDSTVTSVSYLQLTTFSNHWRIKFVTEYLTVKTVLKAGRKTFYNKPDNFWQKKNK